MADEEQQLKGLSGDIVGDIKPERATAIGIVAMVTAVVIGVILWVFLVQLLPDKELEWPGKNPELKATFYKNEPKWI